MLFRILFASVLFFFTACANHTPGPDQHGTEVTQTSEEALTCTEPPTHSTLHKVALYIPNRIFDLLDIIRLRVRVGPGVGVSVRATKLVQVYLGAYFALYGGLPGPRQSRTIPWPVGLESYNGVALSLLEATADAGFSPNYSDTEFGIGLQLAIIGIDFGIDPGEVADFILGLLTFDVRKDDL